MKRDLLTLLSALQLTDSLFPSGLYTLSHGLESYAQAGLLSATTMEPLIADLLRFSAGPSDGVALARAHESASINDLDLAQAADLRLTAVKLAREPRETSIRTGRQLLSLAAETFGGDILEGYRSTVQSGGAPGNHAIVLGLTMATLGIEREEAVAGELYAFAAGCAGSALRMSIVDHRQVQLVLHNIKPIIAEVVREHMDKPVSQIGGCVPFAEIMSMRHERAELRLFAS